MLLPELDPTQVHWHPVSPRVIGRVFLKGSVLTILALAIGLPTIGMIALIALCCGISRTFRAERPSGGSTAMRWRPRCGPTRGFGT